MGFTSVSFAIWRAVASLLALLVLLGVGLAMARTRATPWAAVSRLERLQLAAMGVFVAGTTLTLFWAFERTTIALALIVFYTFPVMVAVAAVPLYSEHLERQRLAAIGLATVGMVLLLLAPAFTAGALGLDLPGVLFALGAAGFQTAYALVAGRGFASVPALQASTLLRGVAVLFYGFILVPLVIVLGEGSTLLDPVGSIEAWLLILTAGIIGAALPTVLLVAGYRRVGPTRGAVLMLVEPVIGVLLAALLLAERPEPVQLLGGLLVLTGAALVQLARSPRLAVLPSSVAE